MVIPSHDLSLPLHCNKTKGRCTKNKNNNEKSHYGGWVGSAVGQFSLNISLSLFHLKKI